MHACMAPAVTSLPQCGQRAACGITHDVPRPSVAASVRSLPAIPALAIHLCIGVRMRVHGSCLQGRRRGAVALHARCAMHHASAANADPYARTWSSSHTRIKRYQQPLPTTASSYEARSICRVSCQLQARQGGGHAPVRTWRHGPRPLVQASAGTPCHAHVCMK